MLQQHPDEFYALAGREVLEADGERVGYLDLLFVDEESGRRALVPIEGVSRTDERLRLPWRKDLIEQAPSHDEEDNRGLFGDDSEAIGISAEKERSAYAHYGIQPPSASSESVARLRARTGARPPGGESSS